MLISKAASMCAHRLAGQQFGVAAQGRRDESASGEKVADETSAHRQQRRPQEAMNDNMSQPRVWLSILYRIPFIGDLPCYVGYLFLRLLSPLGFWQAGFKRLAFGTSTIWAPKDKIQAVMDGVECLRSHDPEMFLRFAKKQKLLIYYSKDVRVHNLFGFLFGLHERYVKLGSEAVASFIVQALTFSDASPSANQNRLNDRQRAALKIAPRLTLEWMEKQSFDPRLINSWLGTVEKWEQKH